MPDQECQHTSFLGHNCDRPGFNYACDGPLMGEWPTTHGKRIRHLQQIKEAQIMCPMQDENLDAAIAYHQQYSAEDQCEDTVVWLQHGDQVANFKALDFRCLKWVELGVRRISDRHTNKLNLLWSSIRKSSHLVNEQVEIINEWIKLELIPKTYLGLLRTAREGFPFNPEARKAYPEFRTYTYLGRATADAPGPFHEEYVDRMRRAEAIAREYKHDSERLIKQLQDQIASKGSMKDAEA
ncbi:hypothetical protein FQN50_001773 [Emmonsiellopsis sp. PD_5]|nr:hypothetical protein FQN50_001773 [Emmonsiellopsis sp. PD_5]